MTCIEGLLRDSGPALETQVRSRLEGFLGAMLRSYLPQTWVFRTETEIASLEVDEKASVRVSPGARTPADVTIEVGHERLRRALTGRRGSSGGDGGAVHVTAHSAKGRAAYGLLRARLGLSSGPASAGGGSSARRGADLR